MGFLVNFLSKPVISGFTSGAAIIIGMNQIGNLIGVEVARNNHLHSLGYDIFTQSKVSKNLTHLIFYAPF